MREMKNRGRKKWMKRLRKIREKNKEGHGHRYGKIVKRKRRKISRKDNDGGKRKKEKPHIEIE
jgi:hypothetical protein